MGINKIDVLLVYYWKRSDYLNKRSLFNDNYM